MPKVDPSYELRQEDLSPTRDSAFLQSLPVTLTSFVNKSGDIGMRLFPMLLVERQIGTHDASITMALVKGTTVVAALIGGYLGDKLGHKATIIISFVLAAIGMFIMPFSHSAAVICFAGMLTTFGHGLFTAPLRILLVHTVPAGMRQEALAWLRSGNNGAVMIASSIAYVTSGVGLAVLFLFDAVTSAIAVVLGYLHLPKDRPLLRAVNTHEEARDPTRRPWRYATFFCVSFIISLFALQSELFYVATTAQAKMSFGARGVEVYSQVVMLNTLFCMIFAVYASRWIKNIRFAFTAGLILQAVGLIWFTLQRDKMSAYFFSVLFQTLGELVFTSMAQFLLLQIIPKGPREGRIYSIALVIQLSGKALGGALAFYFLVGGMPWIWGVCIATAVCGVVSLFLPKILDRAQLRV